MKIQFGNKERIASSYTPLGISYATLGELNLARDNLEKALALIHDIPAYFEQVEVLNELVNVHILSRNFGSAQKCLMESRRLIDSLNVNKVLKERNYLLSSQLHRAQGEYEKSLRFYMAYDSIKDEILSDEKQNRLAEMRILYQEERQENEVKLLKQEKEAEAQRKNALVIGILLIVAIAVLIVSRLISDKKKEKKIFEINQNLVRIRLEKEEIESSKLKDRLDYRIKELTSLGIFIAQRNETYQKLIAALKNSDFLDRKDAEMKTKSLVKDFESKLKINEDIDSFYSDVEHLHDDFFFRLKTKFPKLTETDKRLAAQLRLNLSSKEISLLNNISVKSVEISRHRLRKKLELSPNEGLTDFLLEV